MWGNWTVCLALVCRIILVIFSQYTAVFFLWNWAGVFTPHLFDFQHIWMSSSSAWGKPWALSGSHFSWKATPPAKDSLSLFDIFDFSWDRPWLRHVIQREFPPQEHWFQMVLDTGRIHLNHHVKPASGGSVQDCKRFHQKSLCHWLSWWLT